MADASQNKEEKHSSVTFSHSPHTINKRNIPVLALSHSPHTTDWYTFHIILIARGFWKTQSGSKWNTGQAHVSLVQQNSILFINGHWIKWNDQRLGKTNSAILQQESYELYVSHSIFNIYSNNKRHLGWRERGRWQWWGYDDSGERNLVT